MSEYIGQDKTLGQYYTAIKDVTDILKPYNLSDKTILEPSIGNGSFYFAIIDRLLPKYGIADICERILTGNDIDPENIKSVIATLDERYGYKVNKNTLLYCLDFLLFPPTQFGMVIGNPPYVMNHNIQPTGNLPKAHYIRKVEILLDVVDFKLNLSEYFLLKALTLSDSVVFVIPDNFLVKHRLLEKINSHITFDMFRDRVLFEVNQSILVATFDKTKPNNIPIGNKADILFPSREIGRSLLKEIDNDMVLLKDVITTFDKFPHISKVKPGTNPTFYLKQNRKGTLSNYTTRLSVENPKLSDHPLSHEVFLSKVNDMIPLIYQTPQLMAGSNKFIGLSSDKLSNNDIIHSIKNVYSLLALELATKEGTIRSARKEFPGFFSIINKKVLDSMKIIPHSDKMEWDKPHRSIYELLEDEDFMASQRVLTNKLGKPESFLTTAINILIEIHQDRNRKIL